MAGRTTEGVDRLRDHLRRHNRQVLLFSTLTLLFAAFFWSALYFVARWFFLFVSSAVQPMDWQPSPRRLLAVFGSTAILLCALAWIVRRLRPNEAPRDEKGILESVLDVLLAAPRVTLSAAGTAGAAVRLDERELALAWGLLRRMSANDAPLPVYAVPLEIPDAAAREKIVQALQLSGLVEIRRTDAGPVLAFGSERARRLAQDRVRLR